MNLNHSFESCHVSQVVDGSLVLANIDSRHCWSFKGFEMLADGERADLIVALEPGQATDRGPLLLRPDEDLPCLDLGKGFLLDLLPLPDEVDIIRIEEKPPLGSMLVIGDRVFLPTISENGAHEIFDLDRGELLIDFAGRDATVIRQWRLGIPTHALGERRVCTLLDSADAWPARA